MPNFGNSVRNAIESVVCHQLMDSVYLCVNDLLQIKIYSKGSNNSVGGLIRKKKYNKNSIVYGAINEYGVLGQHPIYSRKFSKYFVLKREVLKEFEGDNLLLDVKEKPSLLEDNGFSFFKDGNGIEYRVEMRGDRTKDGIFFKAKELQELFEMPHLCKNITDNTSHTFEKEKHYMVFSCNNALGMEKLNNKELYVTYSGLRKIMSIARIGRAKEFVNWIDEVVFTAIAGSSDQRVSISSKILNVDLQCLGLFMNKSSSDVSCLYLIDIRRIVNNKKVFKYGFTKSLDRRFRDHVRKYGSDITLETFCIVPLKNLAEAENELKKSIGDYISGFDEFKNDTELLFLCPEAQKNVKYIYGNISHRYCGDLDSIKMQYESLIKEKEHEILLIKRDCDIQLMKSENQLLQKENELLCSNKDNQISHLKIEILEMKLKSYTV